MMPNFFVIGAARSGTTSLHRYLGSHPEIYMSPVKEPNFFAQEEGRFDYAVDAPWAGDRRRISVLDPAKYRALFDGVTVEKAIGEASPLYMASPGAAARIRRAVPEARLIAVLRHPADRAYTNFLGRLRDGVEPSRDPYHALGSALRGDAPRWRSEVYIGMGLYYERLLPFYERFDHERIRVHLFEDFKRDPGAVLRDLFCFLGVDPGFEADTSVIHNPSGWISNPLLRFVWPWAHPIGARLGPWLPRRVHAAAWTVVRRNLSRPPLPDDLRAEMIERFRPDVLKLQTLLGRDLSPWLR